MSELENEIHSLERLLKGVRNDHREAIAEGWPEADKYYELESLVRDLLDHTKGLLPA